MPILHWLDKDKAIKAVDSVPYRMLQPEPGLCYGDKNTENMLIQGDNLEALKSPAAVLWRTGKMYFY